MIVIAAGPGECDLYWDNRSIGRCTAQLAFIGHFSSAVWQSFFNRGRITAFSYRPLACENSRFSSLFAPERGETAIYSPSPPSFSVSTSVSFPRGCNSYLAKHQVTKTPPKSLLQLPLSKRSVSPKKERAWGQVPRYSRPSIQKWRTTRSEI